MRKVIFVALLAIALLAAGRAVAQEAASQPAHRGIVWSFDPVRGVLQAMPAEIYPAPRESAQEANPEASTPAKAYTGTIDITATVNLISKLPAKSVLRCNASVNLQYEVESTGTPIPLLSTLIGSNNAESVDATVASGVATCRFSIPYSWVVPSSTSTLKITVDGIAAAVGVAADQIDSNGAVVRAYRSTTVQISGPTKIPQDGTTTSLTAGTVL